MIYRRGNMWSMLEHADLFLITTNSYVRRDGELVMGRGIAREAKTRFPHIPQLAGEWILQNDLHNGFYGILTDIFDNNMGLFQVKLHYSADADINVIDTSCEMLSFWITENQLTNVHMNYPGIGAGRLDKSRVEPILNQHLKNLPLTIWEY